MMLPSRVPEVEFAHVTKTYGNGSAVLQAVNLTVQKDEFVSVIGPSGCGKSTILKLISGLTLPTGGTIRIDGMTPRNARETVSYIFQDPTLLPWRTARDAASRTSSVMWFSVPSSSSSPHRPQFDSVSKYPSTSSCVGIGRPAVIRASTPPVTRFQARYTGPVARCAGGRSRPR